MHVAIITAGGAGMFCGSCMHDNTWARALMDHGVEVSLIPTYTPIRVDEKDVSTAPLFFGGINVYLEAIVPFWQKLPRPLIRWLDSPWAINLATRFAVSNDAKQLGALTLAMLDGEAGPNRREVDDLVDFLAGPLKPDIVCFSNALLVGVLKRLKERFPGRVFCTLQGDDIFLEGLTEPYRSQAIAKISERAQQFDGFLVHSAYYRDFMGRYLGLPAEKFHVIPLGIDLAGHDGVPGVQSRPPTVGYFARICPEKGLHRLVQAFQILHRRMPEARLRAGGYLGPRDQKYFDEVLRDARSLGDSFEFIGSPATHAEKVEFLKSLDVLSVPTVYEEPKGIYVLEALANGVPVAQPSHGAFPELIEATAGGVLVRPGEPEELAAALEGLLRDAERRIALGRAGQANVHAKFDQRALAAATHAVFAKAVAAVTS